MDSGPFPQRGWWLILWAFPEGDERLVGGESVGRAHMIPQEVQFKGVEQPLMLYDICGMAGPYQVALRDKPQEVLTPLSAPLAITCYRMQGKAVSAVGIAEQMTAVGLSSATVVLDSEVAVHDNLKVLLERPGYTAHEAYAKVVACTSSEAVLAFTMLTEDAQAFLATYRTPH
jgi:hypothetical protein